MTVENQNPPEPTNTPAVQPAATPAPPAAPTPATGGQGETTVVKHVAEIEERLGRVETVLAPDDEPPAPGAAPAAPEKPGAASFFTLF